MTATEYKKPEKIEDIQQTDPRRTIADALMAWLTEEQCMYLIDEVLSIDKPVAVALACPNCNHTWKDRVTVPDAKAVVSALTDLLSQGFGRPGEAKVEDGAIVFKRLTKMEDDDGGTKPPRKRRAARKAVGESGG